MKRLMGTITIPVLLAILLLCSSSTTQYELPMPEPGDVIITHIGYTLSYNEEHEQAEWVAYELTAEEAQGTCERTDDFREDPEVPTGSASLADYRGSGYDRGHLIPAADMKWSQEAMSASFYLSNMSPQNPSFNRGGWRTLETLVRNWAIENEAVYVTTGGILTPGLIKIGPNGVSVPEKYYKVVLDYREPELKGIGFILPNEKIEQDLINYVMSIDRVEAETGIDFFYNLPDDIEEQIESNVNASLWDFSGSGVSYESTAPTITEPIDLNSASQAELMAIKGIGPVLSERIIAYRKAHGGFSSVDELIHIKGIGPVTLENIRPYVVIKSPKKLEPVEPAASDPIVYITRTGSKYHRGSCSYLRKSKIAIRLSKACARGYTPCSRCRPPRCKKEGEE